MPIIVRLDRVMADRKISLNALADQVGIAPANLSRIKTGKIKAIRFSTLTLLCKQLRCQPGDIMEYVEDEAVDRLFLDQREGNSFLLDPFETR